MKDEAEGSQIGEVEIRKHIQEKSLVSTFSQLKACKTGIIIKNELHILLGLVQVQN